jgi:hypothetical protein
MRYAKMHHRRQAPMAQQGVEQMMLRVRATYPMSSIYKTSEVFMEAMKTPLPDYIEIADMLVSWGGKGVRVDTIYNIKDGNVDEGVKEIGKFLTNFASVDGYKVKTAEVVLPVADALAVLGKSMP